MSKEYAAPAILIGALAMFSSSAVLGQGGPGFGNRVPIDLAGVWTVAYHEDWIEVGTGPAVGDFTGLPLNDAARQRALSWHPSMMAIPERQCLPTPLDYGIFWTDFRIWHEYDPVTQELVAYRIRKEWGGGEQTIYLDGREHPSEYAPHTWQGFSTGEWVGNTLKVTTTHLKEGYSRRNGVPRSDRATMIHYYVRHGDHLTIVRLVDDPDYLTEPLIHTTNYTLNLYKDVGSWLCEYTNELAKEQGYVPKNFYWKNSYPEEFSEAFGFSMETTMGGADQMYPDFIE